MGYRHLLIWSFGISALTGCLKGPSFFKQGGPAELPQGAVALNRILVSTHDDAGTTIGTVAALSADLQVVQASDGSDVVGALAEFPPGSVAIDTDISLGAGENIANDKVVNQLNIGTGLTASGQPVAITSSITMDTPKPFTLAIPLPDGSSLALAGDPYANLSVLYHVNKAADGGADYTGIITRKNLTIDGGVVRFATTFFGTYQAIITAQPIAETKEVAAVPAEVSPSKKKSDAKARFYYVRGPAASSFGDGEGQRSGGFQGWVHGMTRAKVGTASTLSTGKASKAVKTTTGD